MGRVVQLILEVEEEEEERKKQCDDGDSESPVITTVANEEESASTSPSIVKEAKELSYAEMASKTKVATKKPPIKTGRFQVKTVPVPRSETSEHPVIIKPQDGPVLFSKLGSWRQAQLLKNTVGAVKSIQRLANSEWLIGCVSSQQQKKLHLTSSLPGEPGNPIKITTRIPQKIVIGVIKGVPDEPNAERLLRDDLLAQDMATDSIKRLTNKDGTLSGAVRVAFISSQLPDTVKLGYSLHRVVPYVPPVRRCTKCQLLGHTKHDCRRRNPRCAKCGKDHPTQDCQSKSFFCLNCCGSHAASDHRCPEKAIRKLAHELKNTKYLPFGEALVKARSQWEAGMKEEYEQQRDFAVRPQAPRPRLAPPPPKPVTVTSQLPPTSVPCPSSLQEEEDTSDEENKSSSPGSQVDTQKNTPLKTLPPEKKLKRKKKRRPMATTVSDVPISDHPISDHSEDESCPKSSPIEDSIKLIWTTLSQIQAQLTRSSPQAARIMEGVFVILRTVLDIAKNDN